VLQTLREEKVRFGSLVKQSQVVNTLLTPRPSELVDLVTKSWGNFQSRDHTVYSVFPFGPKAEEVMMHGRSNNVSKEGEATTFTWAARMHFRRSEDGKVLIDKYTIITVSPKERKLDMIAASIYAWS
jgi:hypothetical protein